MSNITFEFEGEVVKRIHNEEQVAKTSGNKFSVNYLLVKTTSEYNGKVREDIIPLKVFKGEHAADKIRDLREGFVVKVFASLECSNYGKEEVEFNHHNGQKRPKLFPDVNLLTVTVLKGDLDKESVKSQNKEVANAVSEPEPEDDLPF
jgi:hypothetical protein